VTVRDCVRRVYATVWLTPVNLSALSIAPIEKDNRAICTNTARRITFYKARNQVMKPLHSAKPACNPQSGASHRQHCAFPRMYTKGFGKMQKLLDCLVFIYLILFGFIFMNVA